MIGLPQVQRVSGNRITKGTRLAESVTFALLTIVISGLLAFSIPVSAQGKPDLQLCGSGKLMAYAIFTVGEGFLYRSDCQARWDLYKQETRYMEFHYQREIPAEAFRESAMNYLGKNGIQESEALSEFHKGYKDIVAGDIYAIHYRPGEGLELLLNQQRLSLLEDDKLARGYFSIWLGNDPFDDDLKEELLGIE